MALRATYPGRCRACGQSYPAGSWIEGSARNWRHRVCGERVVASRTASFIATPTAPVVTLQQAIETGGTIAAPVRTPEQIAEAERSRRTAESYMRSPYLNSPAVQAERAAAEAARLQRAADFAARGRVLPPRAARGAAAEPVLTPADQEAARFRGLELDDVVAGPAAPVAVEGPGRFAGLELD